MARSKRLSYDAWLNKTMKLAAAQKERQTAYDTARAREQTAYSDWQRDSAAMRAGRQKNIADWHRDQSVWRTDFDRREDQRLAAEREQRLNALVIPGSTREGWGQFTNRMVAAGLADPSQAWKFKPGHYTGMMKDAYLRNMAQPYSERRAYTPGVMPEFKKPIPQAPNVRDARAAPVQRTIGQGMAGDLGIDMTERYGKDMLNAWGSNVAGFDSQMNPLQRLMGLTDDYYGVGDLSTKSQAARDYGASALWDYAQGQRQSGDISALTESPDLQAFINKRLGLQYGNVDDLLAGLGKYYGHVRS